MVARTVGCGQEGQMGEARMHSMLLSMIVFASDHSIFNFPVPTDMRCEMLCLPGGFLEA